MNFKSKSVMAVGLTMFVFTILAMAIIIPAEVMFYLKVGKWYQHERNNNAGAGEVNDFRLYRNPFTIEKKPGQVRILTVGGSTTYGFGVKRSDSWPYRLEKKLNERHPGKFEVVNLAYLGGHLEGFISDYQRLSRRYIPRDKWLEGARPASEDMARWGWGELNPDIVIIVPIVNDTAPDFTFMRNNENTVKWQRYVGGTLESMPVVRNLAISYYLRVALQKIPRQKTDFHAANAYLQIRDSYKKNLERFILLWGPEIKIFVVGLPWLFKEGDSSESVELAMKVWGVTDYDELIDQLSYLPTLEIIEAEVRDTVKKELAGYSLISTEIGQSLKVRPYHERLRFYLDSIHVTAEGNELFASEIYDLVIRDYPATRRLDR
jgi:lysophospholipase L1-like esterase